MWWEIKNHLEIKNGKLYFAGLSCLELAKKYGTPLYLLNIERVKENYLRLFDAFSKAGLKRKLKIHYSLKANSSFHILKLIKSLNGCLDAVSPFEVLLGRLAGFLKEEILFTGTNVSDEDMVEVGDKAKINIDSLSQLKRYAKLVEKYKFNPKISIRINPGKGAGHIPECITAGEDAKYGIPEHQAFYAFKEAIKLGLIPVGIHQHIGSQILAEDLKIFFSSARKILDIAGKLKDKLKISFEFIDFGGGIGIPYKKTDKAIEINFFAKELTKIVEEKAEEYRLGDFDLYLEPGRYIVGDAEILLVKVVDVSEKYIPELGVDAGFNILDRPARYKTYHEIVNVNRAGERPRKEYRISGNLCESGDVFTEGKTKLRKLPITKEGDILAILNAGAYGTVMSSNYNLRPRAAEIMIRNKKTKLIRRRESFKDLIRTQII